MALRKIVVQGEECLTKVCRPVTEFNPHLHQLLDDMLETLEDANGAGLAAPQVGVLRRVCVVLDEDSEEYIELVNPEIVAQSGEQTGLEGCLSVPGYIGHVVRPEKVRIQGLDAEGKMQDLVFDGFAATCICHEYDHLDGILYTDRSDNVMTNEEYAEILKEQEEEER